MIKLMILFFLSCGRPTTKYTSQSSPYLILMLPGLLQRLNSKTNKKHRSHSYLQSHNSALQLNTYTSHRNWLNHEIWSMCILLPLCEKCPNSDRIRENTDQKNSLFRHYSSSVLMLVQPVSYTR